MCKKTLTLSIVIPVYNEQDYIGACLDAIAAQSEMPDEVIVVDNNSTDNTVQVAKKYNFVTVVSEKKQGVLHARNRGFDCAKFDLIGRIDADTKMSQDWCQSVRELFYDSTTHAVTGPGKLAIAPFFPSIKNNFWVTAYHIGARAYFGFYTLWGSNMAIRKIAWDKVKRYAKNEQNIQTHEDQSLSVLLNLFGYQVRFSNLLKIEAGTERFWHVPKLLEYYKRSFITMAYAKQLRRELKKEPSRNISVLSAFFLKIFTMPIMILFLFLSATSKLFRIKS